MHRNVWLSAVASIAIVGLSACGGHSSGDNNNPSVKTATVKGVAVDELILNGIVKIKANDQVLKETRTHDVTGRYEANGAFGDNVVTVDVSCDTDSHLLIKGKKAVCPAGLNVHAVANVEGDREINVSPLSEIAYQMAKEKGIDKQSVTEANAAIAAAFSINPVLGDPTKGSYEKTIVALHTVAQEEGTTIGEVSKKLAADMSDGILGDTHPDMTKALYKTMEEEGIKNSFVQGKGHYTIPDTNILEPVAAVKGFVSELRTQGTIMNDYLEKEGDNLGHTLENIAIDTEVVTEYVSGMGDMILKAYEQDKTVVEGTLEINFNGISAEVPVFLIRNSENSWGYTLSSNNNNNKEFKGTFVLPPLPDGVQNSFDSLSASFEGQLPYVKYDETQYHLVGQNVALQLEIDRKEESGRHIANVQINKCKITDTTGKNNLSIDSLTATIGYRTDPTDKTESIFDFAKLNSAKVSAIAGEYEVVGTLNVPKYVINTSLKKQYDSNPDSEEIITNSGWVPQEITFDGTLKNTNAIGKATLTGKVDVVLKNAETLPLKDLSDISDETAEQAELKVIVAATHSMPGRPDTLLDLTYETMNDATKHHTLIGSLKHDNLLLSANGYADVSGENGVIKFTDGTDIVAKFIFKNETLVNGNKQSNTGSLITKAGKLAATIETREHDKAVVIKYLDGYVESIF